MLHGLVNTILGRSTRSGAIFSPFDVDPYPVAHIDIYDLIRREEENRQTRALDQDLTHLEPIAADSSYDPDSDPDFDLIPFEHIDLELNLDTPLPVPRARPAPSPSEPQKTRATPSAAKTVLLPIIRATRLVPKPRIRASQSNKPPPPPAPPKKPPLPIIRATRLALPGAKPAFTLPGPAPHVAAAIARSDEPSTAPSDMPLPPPVSPPILGVIRVVRAPPAAASTSTAASRSAKQLRKTAYHKVARQKKRQAEQLLLARPAKRVVQRRLQQSTPLFANLDVASDLHTTSTAWLGLRVLKPDLRAYTLGELRQRGFAYLAWDGRVCRPLLDSKRRCFACLAGRPRQQTSGDTYSSVVEEATAAFEQAAADASGDGRRGDFTAVSAGVSYGGGQLRPGVLLNSPINAVVCATLVANWAVRRIAQFSNSMFRSFAPDLHDFYTQQMRALYAGAPYLRRLFPEAISVFAACTFNLGPNTVTFPHIDAANLAWGWCCITALGNFNPDLGGHLILWDLKLVIRFPPGSTILIPSALLRHSNIAIQQGETRYSFTQFSAGGLFRWVNNGNRSDASFYSKANACDLDNREADRAQRWENGVRMFRVWDAAQ